MADELLFYKHELSQTLENHRHKVKLEIDAISDETLFATDMDELTSFVYDKWSLGFPELGEPVVSNGRTKMEVGRYGGGYGYRDGEGVSVDAEEYTIEIPFSGDKDLFFHRGSTFSMNPPRGTVRENTISHTITQRQPDAESLNRDFDRFISRITQYLGWLKNDVTSFNESIPSIVDQLVTQRRERANVAMTAVSGLKFKIKSRDQAAPLVMPVKRKSFPATLPPPKATKPSEPVLGDAKYEDILKMLRDMSVVLERSPAAFANMDEESLRFQFLVPLNGQFETEARGEVFNSSGKTDILISEKGKNIFIAECKFWRGKNSLKETIDQILGYLSWRDTKAAIILFNRNKDFTSVLSKIPAVVQAHKSYIKDAVAPDNETEFRYLLRHNDDEERQITLSILAFDVPK